VHVERVARWRDIVRTFVRPGMRGKLVRRTALMQLAPSIFSHMSVARRCPNPISEVNYPLDIGCIAWQYKVKNHTPIRGIAKEFDAWQAILEASRAAGCSAMYPDGTSKG
jgi:hypothetical protein